MSPSTTLALLEGSRGAGGPSLVATGGFGAVRDVLAEVSPELAARVDAAAEPAVVVVGTVRHG